MISYIKGIARKIVKRVWGVDGLSLFVKKQKKEVLRRIYTKKFTTADLLKKMTDMGMKEGSVVFIHSSMTEFYNYQGNAVELIEGVIQIIGAEGTLMMPAYPKNKFKLATVGEIAFNVLETPSGAGYLSEVFRTYKGVKRSINLQHSVCAYGKLADYFTSEHHLSETAWDEKSPYFKMSKINTLIFSMGLEPYLRNVTMVHCTESFLRNTYQYFSDFFGKDITYKYLDVNGAIGVHCLTLPVKGGIRSKAVIKKYFDRRYYQQAQLSNLCIEVVESTYIFNRCIELANQGISIYEKPLTEGYITDKIFTKVSV